MLYLSGIIITFFLVIILMTKNGKTAPDHVLFAWLCIIGFHLLLYYWQITGEIYNHTYLLGIQVPMPLLHGPLLYLYTLGTTRRNGLPKRYWLHFLPVIIAYIVMLEFFTLTGAEKITVYKNKGAGFEIHQSVILLASIVSGFTYVLLSFYELRKYRKKIDEEFSNTERISLNWLRYLVSGILVIWAVILLNGDDPLIFGAVVVFVFLLGYFGIRHTGIFTYRQVMEKDPGIVSKKIATEVIATSEVNGPKELSKPDHLENTITSLAPGSIDETVSVKDHTLAGQPSIKNKYEKSSLQKEVADKIHHDLKQLMQTEKIFKKEELSLDQLADMLDVHPNHLSQVINTYENKSFYDYVNTLRIEEFKSLVLLPENGRYTLLSLAFECGFNSKTSFNRNFKKITNLSPSAYLKEINIQLVTE